MTAERYQLVQDFLGYTDDWAQDRVATNLLGVYIDVSLQN